MGSNTQQQGTSYASAPTSVLSPYIPPNPILVPDLVFDGFTDQVAGVINPFLSQLGQSGGGIAELPQSPNGLGIGVGNDIVVPAGVILRGRGTNKLKSPGVFSSAPLYGTTLVPAEVQNFTNAFINLIGDSARTEYITLRGFGIKTPFGPVPPTVTVPMILSSSPGTRVNETQVVGGPIAYWNLVGNGDCDVERCIFQSMTTPSLVQTTANGTQTSATINVANSAGIVPGMVLADLNKVSNAAVTWVLSAGNNQVVLNNSVTINNGNTLNFYSGVGAVTLGPDSMWRKVRFFQAMPIMASGDLVAYGCHFSESGSTSMPNLLVRMNNASAAIVGGTIDCGTSTLALIERMYGALMVCNVRFQNGSALNFPIVQDDGVDTANGTTLYHNKVINLSGGTNFSGIINYLGSKSGLDVVDGMDCDSGSFVAANTVATIYPAGNPAKSRGVTYAGVTQAEWDNYRSVAVSATQLLNDRYLEFTGSSALTVTLLTTGLNAGQRLALINSTTATLTITNGPVASIVTATSIDMVWNGTAWKSI